ncbi:Uncharacterized protein DBV15_09709 [Temnothorax longispinosus]|uniref:Uncharacterized protein n=1 Tax=Temnothorax longispinosus TaxID=300112 RepID=A0A4S2L5T2_9HYME|nr:Uncharacterized protein DBV15_09709 [Temnothorax longispinosus]
MCKLSAGVSNYGSGSSVGGSMLIDPSVSMRGPSLKIRGNEVAYIKMFSGRRFANVNIPAGSSAGFSAVVPNSFPAFRWARRRWCDFVGLARPAIHDDNSRSSGAPNERTGGIPIRPSRCAKWTV